MPPWCSTCVGALTSPSDVTGVIPEAEFLVFSKSPCQCLHSRTGILIAWLHWPSSVAPFAMIPQHQAARSVGTHQAGGCSLFVYLRAHSWIGIRGLCLALSLPLVLWVLFLLQPSPCKLICFEFFVLSRATATGMGCSSGSAAV